MAQVATNFQMAEVETSYMEQFQTPEVQAVLKKKGENKLMGGWHTLDHTSHHVKELGKLAVKKHNQQSHKKLVFVAVLDARSQIVAGTNYALTIAAMDGKAPRLYEAMLFQSLTGDVELKSFIPIW